MTAVADRTEFLRMLELSKLIEPEKLKSLLSDPEFPSDQGEAAEKLIRMGELTRFQAKQLLAGKHRGFVLGPYKILDQIGKGGMGSVFLGEHAGMEKKLAIKVLAKELANDTAAIERFQREARAASALTHPNIVRVHHFGQTGDNRYLVMEYVNGATIEQILDRKGPFTVVQAVRIAMQAGTGLHHAHQKGFVHRDIKPENLMLTKEGHVKILDMGLTKQFNKAEDNLTGTLNPTLILGTIDYLSPEQAMQGDLDHRADIYSLGATLFAMITGHSPYEGVPARQKLMQHQCGKVPNLAEFNADVPDELAAVVAKMMAKKAADRQSSMAEVLAALKPWAELDGETTGRVMLPSGVTSVVMSRSMTPTVRDQAGNTAPISGVSAPVHVALPTPIEPISQVRQSPAVPAKARGQAAFWIAAGIAAAIAAAAAFLL
jgi:serine/threonine protein kinase